MKRNTAIQLKAAFLLLVFALNTVIGFACSVGVDMGFNAKHSCTDKTTKAVAPIHNEGKQHIHPEHKSHHQEKTNSHSFTNSQYQSSSKNGNCCTDNIREFEQLDKSVPQSVNLVHPVFFTTFLVSFYHMKLLPSTDVDIDIKPFVRSDHPPIPDIRIAIQSFQI